MNEDSTMVFQHATLALGFRETERSNDGATGGQHVIEAKCESSGGGVPALGEFLAKASGQSEGIFATRHL